MAYTGWAPELRRRWTHRHTGLLGPWRLWKRDHRPQPPEGVQLACGVQAGALLPCPWWGTSRLAVHVSALQGTENFVCRI